MNNETIEVCESSAYLAVGRLNVAFRSGEIGKKRKYNIHDKQEMVKRSGDGFVEKIGGHANWNEQGMVWSASKNE